MAIAGDSRETALPRGPLVQATAAARALLGDAAVARLRAFVFAQRNADGGFRGRADRSDLYYTAFALDALAALGASVWVDGLGGYLTPFGEGEALDFVHRASLARCWAYAPDGAVRTARVHALLRRCEACRAPDGGYAVVPGAAHGSLYAGFLAFLGYASLGQLPPDARRLGDSVRALRLADGAYANERGLALGATPATAAAAVILFGLGEGPDGQTRAWLAARAGPGTGFRASAAAPLPDLLSTATALFALRPWGPLPAGVREGCLAFVEGLWREDGGFRGHASDPAADCEYTFYGLLALGCLAAPA